MIHGDDLIVTTNIGGTQAAVAACQSCSFDINQNFILASPPNSGRAKKKISTDYDWSVSCDCLVVNPQYAKWWIDACKNGVELDLQFLMVGFKVVGKAFVKSCKANGPKGSLAKFSVQFEGSEEIDTDSQAWDFINGTLYTYSNFDDGTLEMGGSVTNGTLANTSSQSPNHAPALDPSES